MPDDGADQADSPAAHDGLGELLAAAGHRGTEHALPQFGVRASRDDLVRLLDKVELEQLVCLVEDEMAHAASVSVAPDAEWETHLVRSTVWALIA